MPHDHASSSRLHSSPLACTTRRRLLQPLASHLKSSAPPLKSPPLKLSPPLKSLPPLKCQTSLNAKLADDESFLFHMLRTIPSPFTRFEAMLFRANFEHEVADLKQSLQTLDAAFTELKTRGLFLKLLEAVLKAGNLMNAGTARGNAQAFNLSALCKLSDMKSTDGGTTLLHFVVEEVIRSEGKRLLVNQVTGPTLDRTASCVGSREEREKEYIKLGLPVVGSISDEFASAKKAAGVDYDALSRTCASLGARLTKIKAFLGTCGGDGFAREMGAFVAVVEEELRAVKAEQVRVLELVRSTTGYGSGIGKGSVEEARVGGGIDEGSMEEGELFLFFFP